jgi:hypothetical protein
MTRPAFNRGLALDQTERDSGARRCLEVIEADPDWEQSSKISGKEKSFVLDMQGKATRPNMYVTERQLAWLRDIKDKLL